jgi:hypothetical protein
MNTNSKVGGPAIGMFWIARTPIRRMNFGPRLFWTNEGWSNFVAREEAVYPNVKWEVFAVDTSSLKVVQVK